jgi:hypothetical protein
MEKLELSHSDLYTTDTIFCLSVADVLKVKPLDKPAESEENGK